MEREGRGSYHNLHSSIFRDVDHFVALNVSVGRVPRHRQRGDGWVGHHHVVHSTQRHCGRKRPGQLNLSMMVKAPFNRKERTRKKAYVSVRSPSAVCLPVPGRPAAPTQRTGCQAAGS